MRVDYQEDELPVSIKISMDDKGDKDSLALNLRKLEDVVQHEIDDAAGEAAQEELDMEIEYEEIERDGLNMNVAMNTADEGPVSNEDLVENEEKVQMQTLMKLRWKLKLNQNVCIYLIWKFCLVLLCDIRSSDTNN